MSWLARYYDHQARESDRRDFLKQVGHTESGRSISDSQFRSMLASIKASLNLQPDDVLLDLCCGNGVFTRYLAEDVARAVGVDFSSELISIAETQHQASNLVYKMQDMKKPDGKRLEEGRKFTKVLMNAALQHFTPAEFRVLLKIVLACSTRDCVYLFSFVPDFDKREAFETALKPGFKLRLRRLLGRDLLGHWWQRDQVWEISASLGLKAEFLDADPALDGSRYRFDIRLS